MFTDLRGRIGNKLTGVVRSAVRTELGPASGSPAAAQKVEQVRLYQHYQALVRDGRPLPRTSDTGYRIYSQVDEDGILLFLFAVLGARTRTFVDIGSGDGIASNCANLVLNFGWHGVFIDGSPDSIERGRAFYDAHPDTQLCPPSFLCARVSRENINDLVVSTGFGGEVDLLSIDIDGNDYWVWDVLQAIAPRVVIIETHVEFGTRSIVVPYDPNYSYPGRHPDYNGASPAAMQKLANRKGYRLVAANRYGFNTIYAREDEVGRILPELTVNDVLAHPRNAERQKRFDAVKDFPYVEV